MKKKYLLLIAIFTFTFVLVGCGKSSELEGTWKGLTDGESRDTQMETTFTFKSGGEVEYKNEFGITSTGKYELKDNIVVIDLETWDKAKEYEYKVDGDKLSLKATDVYSPSYSELVKQ